MKKRIKIITTLILVMVMSLMTIMITGCKEEKVIKMGTNAAFPPFEFIEGGKFAGIDIELSEAIAKDLGMELKVENMEFGSLIDALSSGKVDFVAAGMSVDPDREKQVDFTINYYNATQAIIVKGDNESIKGDADLEGKKLGVQTGTTGQDVAEAIKDAEVSKYDNGMEAVMDLKNGKIDAVVIDNFPAQKYVENNPELKIVEGDFEEEYYAMAVKKGNTELLEKINATLQKLIDDGTYQEILDKYTN